MALGAGQGDVVRGVLREGFVLAAAGMLIGSVGAYLVGRAMQSTLYGTGEVDWRALLVVAAILLSSRRCWLATFQRDGRVPWIR